MNESQHDLLELMEGRGWIRTSEIRRMRPMTANQLRDKLVRLEENGLVEKRLSGSMIQPHAEWRRTEKEIPPVDCHARTLVLRSLTDDWQSTKDVSEASLVSLSYTLQILKKLKTEGLVVSCRITQSKHMATAWRLAE